jgi:hypothetical protein
MVHAVAAAPQCRRQKPLLLLCYNDSAFRDARPWRIIVDFTLQAGTLKCSSDPRSVVGEEGGISRFAGVGA